MKHSIQQIFQQSKADLSVFEETKPIPDQALFRKTLDFFHSFGGKILWLDNAMQTHPTKTNPDSILP